MKAALIFCFIVGVSLAQDYPVCEVDGDCMCMECNSCGCVKPGDNLWACTRMACEPCEDGYWNTHKNTTKDGSTCKCECVYRDGPARTVTHEPIPEPTTGISGMCRENDCTCDECNTCSCHSGMWACTRMGCPVAETMSRDGMHGHSCFWHTDKSWDIYGNAQCSCDCVTPPSAASSLKAGISFLIGLTVLGKMLHRD